MNNNLPFSRKISDSLGQFFADEHEPAKEEFQENPEEGFLSNFLASEAEGDEKPKDPDATENTEDTKEEKPAEDPDATDAKDADTSGDDTESDTDEEGQDAADPDATDPDAASQGTGSTDTGATEEPPKNEGEKEKLIEEKSRRANLFANYRKLYNIADSLLAGVEALSDNAITLETRNKLLSVRSGLTKSLDQLEFALGMDFSKNDIEHLEKVFKIISDKINLFTDNFKKLKKTDDE